MLSTHLRRCLCLVTLTAATGCITPITDRPWIRVETENFLLYSQITEPETVSLAEKLETFREVTRAFTNAGSAAFQPVIPTITYVFDSAGAYRTFAPPESAGFIAPRQRANYIALNGRERNLAATRIIYHEFVHYLLRSGGSAGYPRWYDEGIAEYLGSTLIDDEKVAMAAIPDDRIPTLRYGLEYEQLLPLERLMKAGDTSQWSSLDNSMFYAQAWALVHYLNRGSKVGMPDRSQQLGAYLDLLNRGIPTDQAFDQAFDTTFSKLGKELERYLTGGKFMQLQTPRSGFPPAKIVSVRAVSKPEIARELGRLALVTGNGRRARSLFETSLALEPESSRALSGLGFATWMQGQSDYAEVRGMLERAVELDPKEALNHLDLAEYLLALAAANASRPEYVQMLEEARGAFVKAIELDPDLPEAYARAAYMYQLPGQDWRKGLPLIEQAHALLPTDVSIATTLAEFCVLNQEYERAQKLLDTSAQWAAESGGADAQAIERVRARLTQARQGGASRSQANGG